jgi:hypothetical protein
VDPGYEERSRTGKRIIAVGCGVGCIGGLLFVVGFLALWQFLAPVERTVPNPPGSAAPE